MIRKNYDKILLGLALVVLLVISAFSLFRPEVKPISEFVDIPRLTEENTFDVSPPPQVELEVVEWTEPAPQSAGPEWIFDLFTPPVIYYNSAAGVFDVRPTVDAPGREGFGVELVAIREELYRVQLLGYVGRKGDFLINLENVETGELVLAREGGDYPELGVTVRSFQVERVPVQHEGRTDVFEEVARVTLYDHRLEREVELRSDARLKDDRPTAIFRRTGNAGEEIRARQGESFEAGDYSFLVEEIEPPVATVVRTSKTEPEERQTQTLTVSRRVKREATDAPSDPVQPSPPASGNPPPPEAQPQAEQPPGG